MYTFLTFKDMLFVLHYLNVANLLILHQKEIIVPENQITFSCHHIVGKSPSPPHRW